MPPPKQPRQRLGDGVPFEIFPRNINGLTMAEAR